MVAYGPPANCGSIAFLGTAWQLQASLRVSCHTPSTLTRRLRTWCVLKGAVGAFHCHSITSTACHSPLRALFTKLAHSSRPAVRRHMRCDRRNYRRLQVGEVDCATTWVLDNAHRFGGDPRRVHLYGHSAGAHLCLMALLARAAAVKGGDARMPRQAILAAGVYDLCAHYEYEAARGVHKISTMERAAGGAAGMAAMSPSRLVADAVAQQNASAAHVAVLASANGVPDSHDRPGSAEARAESASRAQPAPLDRAGGGEQSFYASFEFAGGGVAARVLGDAGAERTCASGASKSERLPWRRGASQSAAAGANGSGRCFNGVNTDDLRRLPPLTLMSGTADLTVPWYESVEMATRLRAAGLQPRLLMYDWVPHEAFATAWRRRDCGRRGFQADLLRLIRGGD